MIIPTDFKSHIESEIRKAKELWIASAMISNKGWNFIQKNIPISAQQNFLIGIDLSTEPSVFESILKRLDINARIYQNAFTFHPKVYIIQKQNLEYVAFIGSSNTTSWGLEKNIEMNYKIIDQEECLKLIKWFDNLWDFGQLVTKPFLEDYKIRFKRVKFKSKEIENEVKEIEKDLSSNNSQFFDKRHHDVFEKIYHDINSENLKEIRKSVRNKLLELHKLIYPQFKNYGLINLHSHHSKRELVSRHYFNTFSGNYINAMWLHYGKSENELGKSETGEISFIDNIRMQVIVHHDSVGIWLVLGRPNKSLNDRKHFRNQLNKKAVVSELFKFFKKLDDEYWINTKNFSLEKALKSEEDLAEIMKAENKDDYFIIGKDINYLNNSLAKNNIDKTVLNEFEKLYPIYEIMKNT